jgi:tRNA(Phe) wybutosine-synthesizing methylase Tyw3
MLAIIIIIHLLNVTILVSLQMSDVLDNFGKELHDMLCRTEKLEDLAAENSKGVERNLEEIQRHSEKLELLDKKFMTEDHVFQQFSKNKGIYLFTLRHELFIMHFPAAHHGQH